MDYALNVRPAGHERVAVGVAAAVTVSRLVSLSATNSPDAPTKLIGCWSVFRRVLLGLLETSDSNT